MSSLLPGKKMITLIAGDLFNRLCDMDEHELIDLLEAARSLTPTNCWFVEYWMKDSIIKAAESKLEQFQPKKAKP